MTMNGKDPATRRLACDYIRRGIKILREHLEGAKTAKDIEDVHQVRVACRRTRAALRLLGDCFEAKSISEWQKRIKKLLKSFGAARDLDVQIVFLEGVVESLTKEQKKLRPGVTRMLLRWKQKRQEIQKSVIQSINRLEKSRILMSMHLETERILFEQRGNKPPLLSSSLAERIQGNATHHLDQVCNLLRVLGNPDDCGGHHRLRIAIKKLRYTFEIADQVWDGKARELIRQFKKLQTLLGDLHDCDVWIEQIDAFIETERQNTLDYFGHTRSFNRLLPGLDYLRAQRQADHRQLFEQTCRFAEEMDRTDQWKKIEMFLQEQQEVASAQSAVELT